MLVCNSCDLFNVNNFGVWISKCLNLDGFGVILNCSFDLFIVERIYKCCLNAISRGGLTDASDSFFFTKEAE